MSDASANTPKVYSGHPITVRWIAEDIRSVLMQFAETSGLGFCLDEEVSGFVTLAAESTAWDLILDQVLEMHRLGYVLTENVVRVGRLTRLREDELAKWQIADSKRLAGVEQQRRITLKAARVTDVEPILRTHGLSARGTCTVHPRSNSMILSDLPNYLERSEEIIAFLEAASAVPSALHLDEDSEVSEGPQAGRPFVVHGDMYQLSGNANLSTVRAESIAGRFQVITQSVVSGLEAGDLRVALESLGGIVESVAQALPRRQSVGPDDLVRFFEALSKQATALEPNKGVARVSAAGLLEAAAAVPGLIGSLKASLNALLPLLGCPPLP